MADTADHDAPVPLVCRPPCAVCGRPASLVELVPPGGCPHDWDTWREDHRHTYLRYRDPGRWVLIFEGIGGGNGLGDSITDERAAAIRHAFTPPLTIARVRTADFFDDAGFCARCDVPYCYGHWNVSETGYGRCPHGHGQSLDPHWSPVD